jgi:hypothetical protein
VTGGPASTTRVVDPSLRYGDVGERWGNLVAPSGAFSVGDLLRFQGEDDLRLWRVTRVLAFPADPAKRLVHCEAAAL